MVNLFLTFRLQRLTDKRPIPMLSLSRFLIASLMSRKSLWPILRRPFIPLAASAAIIALIAALTGQELKPTAEEDTTNRIFQCQPDGSGMKLFVDIPDYTAQGSPCWSQDGELIVFDAWRPKLNETNTDSKIIL